MPRDVNLGDLCLAVGNLTDALAYYRAALTSESGQDRDIKLQIVLKISACLRRQGRADEALGLVESVVPSLDGRRLRDLLAERATLLCLLGRYGEAYAVCEEARRYEPADERGKDAGIYLVLGHVLSRLCKWKQAIVCLEQAATFARMSGDQAALGNALNNLGIVYKNICRFQDSARFMKRAIAVARRAGDDASLAVRLLNLATTLLKTGEVAPAVTAVEECARISSLLGLERTGALASICKARLEKARGNLAEALRTIEAVLNSAGAIDEPRVTHLARETQGEILVEVGDLVRARQILEACLGTTAEGNKDIAAEVGSRLADAWLASGSPARARRHAREAMAVARQIGDLYEVGRCLRVLAMCDSASSQGKAFLDRAEGIFRRTGARLEYGLTLAARAELVACKRQSALEALDQAARLLGACGALRARTAALLKAAAISVDLGHHEQAVGLLQEAEAAGSEVVDARSLAAARARVDRGLSGQLSSRCGGTVVSPGEAFEYLKARLGVACLVIGAEEGVELKVLAAYDADPETAVALVDLASRRQGRALVFTGLRDTAPRLAARAGLESALCVAIGEGSSRPVCILGWRTGRTPDAVGSRASRLVEAYHEILGLGAFRASPCESDASRYALCIGGLLTQDRVLKTTLLSLARIAQTKASVLIVGETGTGKDVVARAIHDLSPRRGRAFIAQNCAALPEHLLESELFGHKAGAFTDARSDKRGLLEEAASGTFFLDEVGDVSPSMQAKMLRAIEAGEIRRVGETRPRSIDVRFISATNKHLEEEIDRGRFRGDLYYRLNVVSIALPPLRERRQDIPLLARLFLERFARAAGRAPIDIDEGAKRALVAYPWPGNVRQLEHEIERAVAILGPAEALTPAILSPVLSGGRASGAPYSLRDEIRTVERSRILGALEKCGWNKTHAARMLGDVSRPALVAKMKRLGIALARPG